MVGSGRAGLAYQVAQTLAVELWRAIRDKAQCASSLPDGGARILAERIRDKLEGRRVKGLDFDVHIAAHGAGVFAIAALAPLLPSRS